MSQEADKKAKELKDELLKIEDKDSLLEFEAKNRDEILSGPMHVQAALNTKWKEMTDQYYFQPITALPPQAQVTGKRIDPKGQQYRTVREFEEIQWKAVRVKTRKDRVETFYNLSGLIRGTGRRRLIRQNLRADNLSPTFLSGGDEIAAKILKDHGEANLIEGVIKKNVSVAVEGYWEVIFAPAQSKDDPHDVVLQWEGQCLQIQRNVPVILPGTHLEAADNAKYPVYIQDPERSKEGRKIQGWVQFFPYSVLREATEEEYLEMKAAGDKATRKARREAQAA